MLIKFRYPNLLHACDLMSLRSNIYTTFPNIQRAENMTSFKVFRNSVKYCLECVIVYLLNRGENEGRNREVIKSLKSIPINIRNLNTVTMMTSFV